MIKSRKQSYKETGTNSLEQYSYLSKTCGESTASKSPVEGDIGFSFWIGHHLGYGLAGWSKRQMITRTVEGKKKRTNWLYIYGRRNGILGKGSREYQRLCNWTRTFFIFAPPVCASSSSLIWLPALILPTMEILFCLNSFCYFPENK